MDNSETQQHIQRIQAELDKLRQQHHTLLLENATLDAIGDGILVVGRDREIIRINQQFLDMWEISSEEWDTCQDYDDVKELMLQRLDPDKNSLSPEEMLSPTSEQIGLSDIILKSGRTFERFAGIKQPSDEIIGYVWTFRDVTERRNAEMELNRSQAFLMRIIRNFPVILFSFDMDGTITYSRGAALQTMGIGQGELVGMSIIEQFDGQKIVEDLGQALQGRVTARTHQFGDLFHEVYMGPMREEDEQVGVIGISIDITDQKRAQEIIEIGKELQEAKQKAEEANLAKSTFIANMSHELRTPLNSIIGFSQFLVHDQSLNTEQQEYVSLIMRSSEQLLTLINEILDMAKIESGNIQLNPVDFDLAEVLEGLDSIYRAKITDKNLDFVAEIDDELPRYLWGDRNKIRQILVNLLSNAVKFTRTGQIAMRVWNEEDNPFHLHFQVEDTGVGIAEQDLGDLFLPFAQAESGRNMGSGTGLGLAITQEFCELMGGEITVESTLGQGTIFTISLPLESAKNTVRPTTSKKLNITGMKDTSQTYRILVVDDRWENRMMLSRMLSKIGFDVREASNGQEGLELWRDWQPNLVWMDMRMPKMDGYEATRRIRQSDGGDDVVIIALTASAFEHDRERVMAVGCNDFLAKPFREADMYNMLANHLGIEFIYADPSDIKQIKMSDGDYDFSQIPEVTRSQLKQAIGELNLDKVRELVKTFEENYPQLAQEILDRASEFDFDTLSEWIQ
jgi:PAS domain S-box-containing protein